MNKMTFLTLTFCSIFGGCKKNSSHDENNANIDSLNASSLSKLFEGNLGRAGEDFLNFLKNRKVTQPFLNPSKQLAEFKEPGLAMDLLSVSEEKRIDLLDDMMDACDEFDLRIMTSPQFGDLLGAKPTLKPVALTDRLGHLVLERSDGAETFRKLSDIRYVKFAPAQRTSFGVKEVPNFMNISFKVGANSVKLGKSLGMGAFGAVYEATLNGEKVAVKVFHDPASSERVKDALARNDQISVFCNKYSDICAQSLFPIRYTGKAENKDIAGQLVSVVISPKAKSDGTTLVEKLKLAHLQSPQLKLGVVEQVKRIRKLNQFSRDQETVLNKLSAEGIAHNDIKPSNYLVTTADTAASLEEYTIRLADFDTLRSFRSEKTLDYTPMYAAPEVLAKNVSSPTSDLYSLGETLLEFVLGNSGIDEYAAVKHLSRDDILARRSNFSEFNDYSTFISSRLDEAQKSLDPASVEEFIPLKKRILRYLSWDPQSRAAR